MRCDVCEHFRVVVFCLFYFYSLSACLDATHPLLQFTFLCLAILSIPSDEMGDMLEVDILGANFGFESRTGCKTYIEIFSIVS